MSSHMQDNALFHVPHRQYVFSIPKIIGRYFLYDRQLLGKLSQWAASCLTSFFRITLGKNLGIPGIVMAIQTFGDYAKWHPHVHALVADGLFTGSGHFYVMPGVDIRPLAELFRASVLKVLKDWRECQKSLGGGPASLQPLRWIDEDCQFHLRTPGDQEDPGSFRFIQGGKVKAGKGTTIFSNG